MEWDSLIILPHSKLIINIEVKSGSGINPLNSAAKQTNKRFKIFLKIFGSTLSKDWKFMKAACTPNLESLDNSLVCDYCEQFIIKEADFNNMETWITKMTSNKTYTEINFKEEYENLLGRIIGFSSLCKPDELNKLILDPHEFSKETERMLTGKVPGIQGENEENRKLLKEEDGSSLKKKSKQDSSKSDYLCYMLTAEQLNALKDPSTFIIIDGDYGCGKTYILKERAKQCAEKYPRSKIAFINLTTSDVDYSIENESSLSIMDLVAKDNFKDYEEVTVVTCRDLHNHYKEMEDDGSDENLGNNNWGSVLRSYLNQNSYSHVFIDEIPRFYSSKQIIDFFVEGISFCVTLKHDDESKVIKNWISIMEERYNAKKITLKYNLRNTETIVNVSKLFKENRKVKVGKANKNITGPVCYSYCNKQYYNLKGDVLVRAAINKYFKDTPEEPVVVIVFDSFSDASYNKDFQSISNDRNVVHFYQSGPENEYADYEEVTEYLKNPEGILFTDMNKFHGAQARNIIILGCIGNHTKRNNDIILRDMIMRAMSFVIIIHNKDFEEPIPISELFIDTNLHEYMHLGNTKPECYHYNNLDEVDENTLTRAIMNKFLDCPTNNILFLTNDCGEIISQELKSHSSRPVEYIPHSETIEMSLKNSVQGSIFVIDFLKTYYMKIDCPSILRRFKNIVIFLKDKKPKNSLAHYKRIIMSIRDTILLTTPMAIIVHDGTGEIDKFQPIQMREIKDLNEEAESSSSFPSSTSNSEVKNLEVPPP